MNPQQNRYWRVALAVSFAITLSGCEKWFLDRQMQKLCEKDGGIRVFETVPLPSSMFDQNGDPFPGWRQRSEALRLGPGYLLKRNQEILKGGEPINGEGQLRRVQYQVIRVSDNKVLGEAILYGRSGGDFIVIDHFSSRSCPEGLGLPGRFIQAIFKNEDK